MGMKTSFMGLTHVLETHCI